MRRARLIASIAFLTLAAGSLHAQWQVTADAGAARLRQSGIPETTAPTLGVNAGTSGARWDFASSALAARTSVDRWTAQGVATGTVRSDPYAGRPWDVTGYVSSFSASNERSTVAGEAMAQALFGSRALGASVGVGGGLYAHDGAGSRGRGPADLWRSTAAERFLVDASAVATKAAVFTARGNELRPLSYADLSATWRREYAGLSFGATAGVRAGMQGATRSDEWASVDATAWFSSRAAIVASVGRTLEDAVRGVPRTRYLSLAIRLTAQPHAHLGATPHHENAGVRVNVEATAVDRRRFVVAGTLPATSRVEIMADFTDWAPVMLNQVGAVWVVERSVSPGLHRMAIRIDGGEWQALANLPRVTDDLGGVVGLITVP
jgi:hypothetical protein